MQTCLSAKTAPVAVRAAAPRQGSLRPALTQVQNKWNQRTVSNGYKTRQMLVWQPTDNKMFETLSFLPPLTDDQISKQVDYIVQNGRVPCLEFSEPEFAYVKSDSSIRVRGTNQSNYIDNRYWTMYKLPMFGCTDPGQVLTEISNATKSFPNAYIRLVAFDNVRQVQVSSFLVHRPSSAKDFRAPEDRSV